MATVTGQCRCCPRVTGVSVVTGVSGQSAVTTVVRQLDHNDDNSDGLNATLTTTLHNRCHTSSTDHSSRGTTQSLFANSHH